MFYLHDPERFPFETLTAHGGALDAIVQLHSEGLVGAIGVAGGDIAEMRRYVDTGLLDVVLNQASAGQDQGDEVRALPARHRGWEDSISLRTIAWAQIHRDFATPRPWLFVDLGEVAVQLRRGNVKVPSI